MSLKGKLQKWADAGLITPDQHAHILEHEKGMAASRWKNGLAMAGLFSILLGVALIVAANWQDIPDTVKLGAHFALNATLAALVWRWHDNPARDNWREGALFALWGLTLTLVALIGQVFQLGGETYVALRVWFWLTTPMILLFARGSYIARLWSLAFIIYVPFDLLSATWDATNDWNIRKSVLLGTGIALPLGAWLAGTWPRFAATRTVMAGTLRNLGLFVGVAAASVACLEFYSDLNYPYSPLIPVVFAGFAIATRFILQSRSEWTATQRAQIDTLCLSALFLCAPFIASVESDLMALLHFLALWVLLGWVWQRDGQAQRVSFAIAIITLRLFIGFIELFGSMMLSGFGFILLGLVLLGLVKGARALDKRLKGGAA